ncbi:MAG: endonuclease/exonuclease/phosphatase family metal-dependent hydrolase [Saprospiraceae bacterium]|jgi:endonuclease/exonuclease/phosphatase family metal-dependent hydrolase
MNVLNYRIFLIVLLACNFIACNQSKSIDLKVMSFNIRHGVGMDNILDLSRSAKVIKATGPDLCGLQEVDNFCSRSDSVGQTEFLAKYGSMEGTFGKFMNYQGGEYGMATLSSKRLLSTKILNLPDGKHEPRISIVHSVELVKGAIISFANVHFDWIEGEEGDNNRLAQAKTLVAYIDSLNLPAIIIGDFNCTPDSRTMEYFKHQGFVFAEKGSDNLSFQGKERGEIDHLIYRNTKYLQFNVKAFDLLDQPIVSDHRPLVVNLDVLFY